MTRRLTISDPIAVERCEIEVLLEAARAVMGDPDLSARLFASVAEERDLGAAETALTRMLELDENEFIAQLEIVE